jgi:mitochondrial distribution and morphology protein 10
MTVTVNPLMGQISASYAIKASQYSAFCSRFNFNLYSYESELVVGCELWQHGEVSQKELSVESLAGDDNLAGVLKARVGSNFDVGFTWEARFRNVIFSLGAVLDLLKQAGPIQKIGCEMTFMA